METLDKPIYVVVIERQYYFFETHIEFDGFIKLNKSAKGKKFESLELSKNWVAKNLKKNSKGNAKNVKPLPPPQPSIQVQILPTTIQPPQKSLYASVCNWLRNFRR